MSKEKKSREKKTDNSGSFIWPNGSEYEGEYREDIDGTIYRHGFGTYRCSKTQTVYAGNWEMDKMSGKGNWY